MKSVYFWHHPREHQSAHYTKSVSILFFLLLFHLTKKKLNGIFKAIFGLFFEYQSNIFMFGKTLFNFSFKLWIKFLSFKIILNLFQFIILDRIFELNGVHCDFWNLEKGKLESFRNQDLHQSASRVLYALVIVLTVDHHVIWKFASAC